MENETAPLDPAMKALAEREEALEIVGWLTGYGGLHHSQKHGACCEEELDRRLAAGETIGALREQYKATFRLIPDATQV